MAKAIGLDIGSRTVKLVELDGSAKKFKITKFRSVEIPGEGGVAEGEIVSNAVGDALKGARAVKDTLVASMDSRSVVIREILVPFLEKEQIRRVLKFEAEAHLHNYAIEDVVVDYVKVGEVQEQSKILIFAAPKERILERLELLRQHGVDPMHLDLDMTALFNAARAVGAFKAHPNCVVLDIGAATTTILFVKDGRLRSCRSLRSGSESLTRVLSEDLAVDTDAARERLERGDGAPRDDDLLVPLELDPDEEDTKEIEKSAAQLEQSIVLDRQGEFLSRIYRETTRSLATYSSDAAITAIYLTGGASLSGGVDRRLGERFRVRVERLDFLGENGSAVPDDQHEFANASVGVAMGCALKMLDHDGLDVEFRRDEMRYTRKFDLIKVALASTVSLIFILLFLIWLNYQNALRVRRTEHRFINELVEKKYVLETKDMYTAVLEDNAERIPADTTEPLAKFGVFKSQVKKMHNHITSKMGFNVKGVRPIRSALLVLREVSERLDGIRADLGYLYLDEIKVTQKTIIVDGQIGHRGNVDLIAVELNKLPYVERVERDRTEIDPKTNKAKFGLTAHLTPMAVEAKR